MASAGLLVYAWQLEVLQKIVFDIAKKALKTKVMKEVFIGHKNLNETFKSYAKYLSCAKYLPKSLSLRAKFLDELRL